MPQPLGDDKAKRSDLKLGMENITNIMANEFLDDMRMAGWKQTPIIDNGREALRSRSMRLYGILVLTTKEKVRRIVKRFSATSNGYEAWDKFSRPDVYF